MMWTWVFESLGGREGRRVRRDGWQGSPFKLVGLFESTHYPNLCWAFTNWGGSGGSERFGVVSDISDGPRLGKIQSEKESSDVGNCAILVHSLVTLTTLT